MSQASVPTPDPRALEEDLLRALAVLVTARNEGTPWLSAAEISTRLRDRHGISLHWRTIQAVLEKSPTLASRRRRVGRTEFQIMHAGEELVLPAAAPVYLVNPGQAVQAVSSLHRILAGLQGTILICDPYVDAVTIEHLDSCPAGAAIQLLTENVRESGKLTRLVAAMRAQSRRIEIRIAPPGQLHDRYIVDDNSMYLSGASLNGFGKRQSFLIEMGPDVRSLVVADFQRRWAQATLRL